MTGPADLSSLKPLLLIAMVLGLAALPASAQVDVYQGETIPAAAVAQMAEARAQRRAGDYEAAIERLQALVEQQPDYYLAWYNLGLARAQANETDAAMEALQRALELKERLDIPDPTIYNSLGWGHYLRGDYLAAKPLLEKAVEQQQLSDRSRQKALNNLGVVLMRLQDYEGAEQSFQEAAELGSSRAEANLKVVSAVRSVKMQQRAEERREGPGGG